jgi:FMN phosphatase YigB (HAD superfamily)
MRVRKPNDAIYEQAERITGLSGSDILFFDDLEANVTAARGRAWNAVQIAIDGDPVAQVRRHLGRWIDWTS